MIRKIEMLLGLLVVSSTLILGCSGNLMAKNISETISGKKWLLTSIEGEKIPEESKIYAEFSKEDGKEGYRVSGSSGCNMFRGGANITDTSIKVQHLLSTRKACKTPEKVMERESRFLKALESSATFQNGKDILNIMDASGKTILSFKAEK